MKRWVLPSLAFVSGCAAVDQGGGSMMMARKRGLSESLVEPYSYQAPAPAAPQPRQAPPPERAPEESAGIGLGVKNESGAFVIQSVVPGGAAAADGRIQPGDRLQAVAQGDGPLVELAGMTLPQAVGLLRGPVGTIVRVRVAQGSERKVISLVRQGARAP